MRALALGLLVACAPGSGGAGFGNNSPRIEDYAPPEGRHVELAEASALQFMELDNQLPVLMIREEDGRWWLREGEGWRFGEDVADYPVEIDGGLWIAETEILPAPIAEATEGDGVRILGLGSLETWYGTFDNTVTVEVDEGDWAGEQVFARDIGLIRVTWRGIS